MDISGLKVPRRNLNRFLDRFEKCIKTKPSFKHMRTYVNGQVSHLPRKSIEPIALDACVQPRKLQQFFEYHRWDEIKVRDRVQEIVKRDFPDPNAIATIDETSFIKKGDKTVCVARQYCGASGKIDNCVVSVNLGYVAKDFHTLINTDLYLPEKTWANDKTRREMGFIPDDIVYRPKWKIALELLEQAIENRIQLRYLTADELYGRSIEFRRGVAKLGITYVVEIPRSIFGWTKKPTITGPQAYSGFGRPNTEPKLALGEKDRRRVDKLWQRGGPTWEMFHVKNTEKGPLVWEARVSPFFQSKDGLPAEEERLIVARNVITGEVKYFLTNAPVDMPVTVLLHVAFSRWTIERIFEDAKGQVGLDHFEVRNYRPVMRHMILSMVSLLFLMKETHRLRKKKSMVEPIPSQDGRRSTA